MTENGSTKSSPKRPYRVEEDEGWAESASPAEIARMMQRKNDKIEELEHRISDIFEQLGPGISPDVGDFLLPFVSRFTLDDGKDGAPELWLELRKSEGQDYWVALVRGQVINQNGELEDDIDPLSKRYHAAALIDAGKLADHHARTHCSLAEAYKRLHAWAEANPDPEADVDPSL